MNVLDTLNRLLDHLSVTLDDRRQEAIDERYGRTLDYMPVDRPPCITMGPLPGDSPFKLYPHGQILADPRKMLHNELVYAFDTSIAMRDRITDDLPLTVRPNFGTVLIASMFGDPVEQAGNNPPWVYQREGETTSLAQVRDTAPDDRTQGWIPRVIEAMECYHELLSAWPEVQRQVRVVLPDLQGPFDNLELICGSDVFLQLVTEPELVDAALATLAQAQISVTRQLLPWTNDGPLGYCHQHAVALKGNILLRNDSCIMVSAEMYRRQIAPHDEWVFSQVGGGGIHSCGDISHLVDEYLALPSIRSLDFGQSEKNNIDAIYTRAAKKKIALIRVAVSDDDLNSGRAAARFPTGVVFVRRYAADGRMGP